MLDKLKCNELLRLREKQVEEMEGYLKTLKHGDEYVEIQIRLTRNPFKKRKAAIEAKQKLESLRTLITKLYGITKVGEGEESNIAFLITFESHINSLKEDIDVLKKFLKTGEEFDSLPSSRYDKGLLKM